MQLLMCMNNISPLKAIYNIYVKNKLHQLKKVKLWRLRWRIDLLMIPHHRLHSSPAISSYMSGTKKKKQDEEKISLTEENMSSYFLPLRFQVF